MLIEQIGIETLIPYANNARTHSDAQVAQIAASIREFGFNNPVLIDKQSSIIAGHGRVLAARKLELDSVPCIRLDHLSDTQRRAYIIADNKIAMNAGWDEELLALEFEGLGEEGFDLELTGFTLDEIELATIGTQAQPSSAKEIDPDDYKMGCKCPKCGFEFDDKNA
jgi:ParB family chromosome partitioning protein